MGIKKPRVRYELNPGDIRNLSAEEIKAILRAADELIGVGGRNLLAKILKGSKDQKVIKHGCNLCPVYGYFQALTLQEITCRIDWMIQNGYLEIEYRDRLPVLVYSESGWQIERETFALELLQTLQEMIESKDYSAVQELKGRNRGMILLLLEKIKSTDNPLFIPLLNAWRDIEFKKVSTEISQVIQYLGKAGKNQ